MAQNKYRIVDFLRIFCVFAISLCSGCAVQSAMPLGNDMMQIDVSAAPVYGRAGAQRMAYEKAAKATLDAGYDRFVVMNNKSWTEMGMVGGSSGSATAYSASFDSGFSTHRHPETSMVIKMFRNGDKGASKAIDARAVLTKAEQ